MKKFYSILVGVACSIVPAFAVAQNTATPVATLQNATELHPALQEAKQVNSGLAMKAVKQLADEKVREFGKKHKLAKAAPQSIIGNTYVTTYVSFDEQPGNSYFKVVAGSSDNEVILENFAGEFDVKASYDASTGQITIPASYDLGTYGSFGKATLYAINSTGSYYRNEPIVGTVTETGISFNYGAYASVAAGGLALQMDLTGYLQNGEFSCATSTGVKRSAPVYVQKTSDTEALVIGMNVALNNILFASMNFGANFNNVITFNESTMTADAPFEPYSNYGDYGDFYFGMANEQGLLDDSHYSVEVKDNTTVLSALSQGFYGYDTTGRGNFSGAYVLNAQLSIDYDFFTAEVVKIPTEDDLWEDVGNATFMDGWVLPAFGIDQTDKANWYEVPLQQNIENKNLYRLVDPYHQPGFPALGGNASSKVGYIEFDVTDPEHVLVNPNMKDAGFANASAGITAFYPYNTLQFFVNMYSSYGFDASDIISLMEEMPYTTYKDGIVNLSYIIDDDGYWYDANFGDQDDTEGGYVWKGDMSAMIIFPGASIPEDDIEVSGTLTVQMDMYQGMMEEPDLLPVDTYSVKATYNADAKTITLSDYTVVSEDYTSGLEGLNPLTLTIDIEKGTVTAEGEQVSSSYGDGEDEVIYYYSDVAKQAPGIYGKIANISETQCHITLDPWGEGLTYPGYGYWMEFVYYNTDIVLDLNIEGLAYEPVVSIDDIQMGYLGDDITLKVTFTADNLPEDAKIYAEVKDIFGMQDDETASFIMEENPLGLYEIDASPAIITIPGAYLDEEGNPAYHNYRVILIVKNGDEETIATSEARETGIDTGVDTIGADAAAKVRYYNLQGVEVTEPADGIFIKVEGTKTTKVVK